jgi:hypothetical protein
MPDDPILKASLQQLSAIVGGMNPQGGPPPSMADRLAAGDRYRQIKERIDAEARRQVEGDRDHLLTEDQQGHSQEMDKTKLQIEAAKVHASIEVENQRLVLEAERIEVAKAEVIVRALEAAARNPELLQLTEVVKEMSWRLLGGEVLPAIEDKGGE